MRTTDTERHKRASKAEHRDAKRARRREGPVGEAPEQGRPTTIDAWTASLHATPSKLAAFDEVLATARSEIALQMKRESGVAPRSADAQQVAAAAIGGGGKPLPHRDRIQAAFGRHDVSSVRSFVDGAAAEANRALGARAFAMGDAVAFAREPDLHLAAHEAAHVVQQRGGVSLMGGIGARGDVYERHADEVADAVVSGRPAESLLDRLAGAGTRTASTMIQRDELPRGAQGNNSAQGTVGTQPAVGAEGAAGAQGAARPEAAQDATAASRRWVMPRSGARDELIREARDFMVRAGNLSLSLIFVVTDQLYAFGTDGQARGSWRITSSVPLPGGFYSNLLRFYTDDAGAIASIGRGSQTPGANMLARWTRITEADLATLTGGRDFLCIVGSQYVASNDPPPPGGTGIADRETREGAEHADTPPSANEFVPDTGASSNVRQLGRAYRARLDGPEVGAIGGEGRFELHLFIDDAADGRDSNQQSRNIDRANTLWEVFDVTAHLSPPGASRQQAAERRADVEAEVDRTAVGGGRFGRLDASRMQAARRGNERAAENLGEDVVSAADDPNVVRRAATLLTMPFQAAASLGRQVFRGYGDWLESQHTRTIEWPRAGRYLVRCIAQPMDGNRRASRPASFATRLIEVRDARVDANEAAREADANIAELRLAAATQPGGAARDTANRQVADAELMSHGDAEAALRRRIELTQADLQAATAATRDQLQAQLTRLQEQLAHLLAQRGSLRGARMLRVEAFHVDEVSGQRTSLLLEASAPSGSAGRLTTELSDVTDRDGRRYPGTGATPLAAIEAAAEGIAGAGLYPRGWMSFAVSLEGQRHEFQRRARPREGALLRQGVQDIGAVSMLVPGAQGLALVSGLANAGVAIENIYQRVRNHTFRPDQSAVSDTLAVLIGVASGLRVLGQRFGVGEAGSSFRVFLNDMGQVGAGAERVLGEANFMVGMASIAHELRETFALEQQSPALARRRRAEIALRALRDGGLQIYGWNHASALTPEQRQAAENAQQGRIDRGLVGGLRVPEPGAQTGPAQAGASGQGAASAQGAAGAQGAHPPTGAATQGAHPPTGAATQGAHPPTGAATQGAHPPTGAVAAVVHGATTAAGAHPEGAQAATAPRPTPEAALQRMLRVMRAPPTPSPDAPVTASQHANESTRAGQDVILATGDWKGALRRLVQHGVTEATQLLGVQNTLTEARRSLVAEVWARVAAEFPGVVPFNAGTQRFTSDIDITVRPIEQMPGFSGTERSMAEQIRVATEAAQRYRELMRERIGGRETDTVLDTNVYAFMGENTGEGHVNRDAIVARRPEDIRATSERQVGFGLAEVRRGMTSEQWQAFRERMTAGAESLPGRSREQAGRDLVAAEAIHEARQAEWNQAARELGFPGETRDPAQRRQIREHVVRAKQRELIRLVEGNVQDSNTVRIIELRSEILWFEPDAYASAPAVDQTVHIIQAGNMGAANVRGEAQRSFEHVAREARAELDAAQSASPPDPRRVRRAEEAMGHIEHERSLRADLDTATAVLRAQREALQANESMMRSATVERRTELAGNVTRIARDVEAQASEVARLQRNLRQLGLAHEQGAELRYIQGQTQRTEQILVGSGMNARERLGHSLAAASSNLGMLRGHSDPGHTAPSDAVKAAGKYGGRILFAVLQAFPNSRPSDSRVLALLRAFTRSRSELFSDSASAAFMRETALDHAREVGLERGQLSEEAHLEAAQRRFAEDVGSWAESEVVRLHQIYATTPVREQPATAPRPTAPQPAAPPTVPPPPPR